VRSDEPEWLLASPRIIFLEPLDLPERRKLRAWHEPIVTERLERERAEAGRIPIRAYVLRAAARGRRFRRDSTLVG
jgi:hypothetical protein